MVSIKQGVIPMQRTSSLWKRIVVPLCTMSLLLGLAAGGSAASSDCLKDSRGQCLSGLHDTFAEPDTPAEKLAGLAGAWRVQHYTLSDGDALYFPKQLGASRLLVQAGDDGTVTASFRDAGDGTVQPADYEFTLRYDEEADYPFLHLSSWRAVLESPQLQAGERVTITRLGEDLLLMQHIFPFDGTQAAVHYRLERGQGDAFTGGSDRYYQLVGTYRNNVPCGAEGEQELILAADGTGTLRVNDAEYPFTVEEKAGTMRPGPYAAMGWHLQLNLEPSGYCDLILERPGFLKLVEHGLPGSDPATVTLRPRI